MKSLLKGLLIFSQAGTSAITINKTNYNKHLCCANLSSLTIDDFIQETEAQDTIKQDYHSYYTARSLYEKAVAGSKNLKNPEQEVECAGNPDDILTSDTCIEKHGILFAQACEQLKQHELRYPALKRHKK